MSPTDTRIKTAKSAEKSYKILGIPSCMTTRFMAVQEQLPERTGGQAVTAGIAVRGSGSVTTESIR